MPKYEKVDNHTIKIIVEKANEVSLQQIVDNRTKLIEQKKLIEETLKNVEEILKEAKKLGITVEEKKENK